MLLYKENQSLHLYRSHVLLLLLSPKVNSLGQTRQNSLVTTSHFPRVFSKASVSRVQHQNHAMSSLVLLQQSRANIPRISSENTIQLSNYYPANTLVKFHPPALLSSTRTLSFSESKPCSSSVIESKWHGLDRQLDRSEELHGPAKLMALNSIIGQEASILASKPPSSLSSESIYHRKCRVNCLSWTAHNLIPQEDRPAFRRPYPEVSTLGKSFQRNEYTETDVLRTNMMKAKVDALHQKSRSVAEDCELRRCLRSLRTSELRLRKSQT